ncbi:GntR family transcriptional regulator [Bradyrhizobium sp. ISRA443]|uniref:GntR family transcriptional regulator n=1 Tax=unclassified Bradyrhizobium TaxID=2631580 RepID=UPI00247B0C60|nr:MULTISPECIES: GntR family transcriptional regulator [unclassified Bradyrhizobium]WGR93063.1 GntR family transcriptional regulator [Bradyrhizobium sp. ISRA435]WGR97564.1 GntR family transcriptional regulator [Bradyrhizobium sp. ISRA436]WGS04454.1 GntR family transcriptional regulator [Bradyrhizobium sp. ISRA437]WGS11335.1 GntR family transcriptional regulator [Bradyrhizobium sp. ISRA443]
MEQRRAGRPFAADAEPDQAFMHTLSTKLNTESKMSRSLRRQRVEQLEGEIAAGALQPGTHIDERSIGERFGISRTPAREVLVELSAAGLVRFVPRRGAVVISMAPQEIVSMVEVLVALEGEAASLATADGAVRADSDCS